MTPTPTMRKKRENGDKIILDLCGGTGSWSRPYVEAGYDVRLVTLPDGDVRTYQPPKNVYGILAAPPCTMFSFARTNAKKPRDLKEGMEIVRACFNIIWSFMEVQQDTGKKTLPLRFWALENPYHGFLPQFLGKPAMTFNPWEFGDMYKKKTAVWGNFNEPKRAIVERGGQLYSISPKQEHIEKSMVKFDKMASKDIHPEAFGKFDRQTRRSITPAGFATAFFNANP
jgi:hypothetical protein